MPGIVKTGTKSYIVCRSLGLSPIGTRTQTCPAPISFMAIYAIVKLPPRPRGLNRWRLWPGDHFQFPFPVEPAGLEKPIPGLRGWLLPVWWFGEFRPESRGRLKPGLLYLNTGVCLRFTQRCQAIPGRGLLNGCVNLVLLRRKSAKLCLKPDTRYLAPSAMVALFLPADTSNSLFPIPHRRQNRPDLFP